MDLAVKRRLDVLRVNISLERVVDQLDQLVERVQLLGADVVDGSQFVIGGGLLSRKIFIAIVREALPDLSTARSIRNVCEVSVVVFRGRLVTHLLSNRIRRWHIIVPAPPVPTYGTNEHEHPWLIPQKTSFCCLI